MTTDSTPAPSVEAGPVAEFLDCHAGIVSHLTVLGELPALLGPAAKARRIAADAVTFFRQAVYNHHQDEERELFPAVLASAAPGAERQRIQEMVDRLTADHRSVETEWECLEPGLEAVAKGREAQVDAGRLAGLVDQYLAHARYEESEFLPLGQQILARNGNHMAALAMSLHARHVLPDLLNRFGPCG